MNAKNAFDIDINCIEGLSKVLAMTEGDHSWQRTGEALGAGAKIYGYTFLVNTFLDLG